MSGVLSRYDSFNDIGLAFGELLLRPVKPQFSNGATLSSDEEVILSTFSLTATVLSKASDKRWYLANGFFRSRL